MSKGDIKLLAIVIVGVVGAGYLMNALRDNNVVNDAIRGFDH